MRKGFDGGEFDVGRLLEGIIWFGFNG